MLSKGFEARMAQAGSLIWHLVLRYASYLYCQGNCSSGFHPIPVLKLGWAKIKSALTEDSQVAITKLRLSIHEICEAKFFQCWNCLWVDLYSLLALNCCPRQDLCLSHCGLSCHELFMCRTLPDLCWAHKKGLRCAVVKGAQLEVSAPSSSRTAPFPLMQTTCTLNILPGTMKGALKKARKLSHANGLAAKHLHVHHQL